jgi:hypothetical protein
LDDEAGQDRPMSAVALRAALLVMAIILAAASPAGFNLQVPAAGSNLPVPPEPPAKVPPGKFQPAPTPNRDVELSKPKASNDTTITPSLFTRPEEYHGDGFSKGSTVQSDQDRRLKPAPGFSLHMPLSPN